MPDWPVLLGIPVTTVFGVTAVGVFGVNVSTPLTVSVGAAAALRLGTEIGLPADAFVASVVNVLFVVVSDAADPAVTETESPLDELSLVMLSVAGCVESGTALIGVCESTTVFFVTDVGVFGVNTFTPFTVSVDAASTEMFGTEIGVPVVTLLASVTKVLFSVERLAAVPAVTLAADPFVGFPIEWKWRRPFRIVMKWLSPLLSRYFAISSP